MKIFLILAPTRTRDHTKTSEDFDNDFWVLSTSLHGLAFTQDEGVVVASDLFEKLKSEIPDAAELPFQISGPHIAWRDNLQKHLQNGIDLETVDFTGDPEATTVYVLFKEHPYRAWGGVMHTRIEPIHAYSDPEAAHSQLKDGYQVVEADVFRAAVPA